MKTDITKNEIYISKFHHVTQSYLTRKKIGVNRRGSDGFVFILDGKCHYTFSDGSFFTAKKGDIMYLAKDASYKMDVDCERYEHIFTNFDFADSRERKSMVISPKNPESTEALFRRLLRRYFTSGSAKTAECTAIVYSIYASFISEKSQPYAGKKAKEVTEKAKMTVAERIADPTLSVSMLAEEADLCEVHFRRLFSKSEGISPSKYVIFQRIKKAKLLLEYEKLTTDEIAIQCGFSSTPYFCKVFKEKTGMTPTDYKKSLKK